ncbi:MAG: TetR/AcrR family transcriptional regulator [Bacteroidia bacterium]|nr:TetR/AcrR family transcriptional regulator [Bacteroidia bacterium]
MENFKNNKKYIAILNTSRELFWKHGVRRVTVEEICREAKTSKMTFYRFFPDKIELAKKVLDLFYEESLLNFRKIIRDDSSASVKMQKMIQMKLEGSNEISNEFIQDFLISANLGLTSYFEEKLKVIWAAGIKEFKLGQDEGWIRKDLNIEFLFFFSQKIIPVLNDKDLLNLFSSPQDLIVEVANLIIYGIAPKE